MLKTNTATGVADLDSLHKLSSGCIAALTMGQLRSLPIMASVQRFLAVVGCLGGLGLLAPGAGHAETSTAVSAASEVDACNQAQYRMPAAATVRSFQINSSSQKGVNQFTCTVRWTTQAGVQPSGRPILFPSTIAIPLFSL
jgi:hypothetical protein